MNRLKSSKDYIKALDSSLEKAAKFVDNNKNFIINISKSPLYNDEPKIFAYTGTYKSRYKKSTDIACGFSFNKKVALMRVLGEGIERYCLEHYKPKISFIGSLQDNNKDYLDPYSICAFSKKQLAEGNFKKFRIHNKALFRWTKGFSLKRKKNLLVPAQLVSFNYAPIKNEPTILPPISTGTATGLSLDDAVYRGICEIVERDSFIISYLNKLPSPHVNLNSIKDIRIQRILNKLRRYKLEIIVLDITTDLKIPAFVALTLDRTGLGPAVSVGLKAGFDIKESIIGAIEESLMTRSWMRDKFIYLNPDYKPDKTIQRLEDRAYFWFPVDMIKELDFWLENKNIKRFTDDELNFAKNKNKLNRAITLIEKNNMEIIYVDITHKAIKKNGFWVIRTIISQLHPLYLDEQYPYFGGRRLYEVPVKMKFFKRFKSESQLNKIPHPFL